MDKIPLAFSIHPGEILRTEFMEPLGLSAYRLAKELHISEKGWAMREELGRNRIDWQLALTSALTDEELASVVPLLRKMGRGYE